MDSKTLIAIAGSVGAATGAALHWGFAPNTRKSAKLEERVAAIEEEKNGKKKAG